MKLALRTTIPALTLALLATWSGCSAEPEGSGTGGSGSGGGDSGAGGGGIGVGAGPNVGGVTGQPWPAEPIVQQGAPAGVEAMFSGAASGATCVTEPQDGAMLPRNWLRPRFRAAETPTAYMVVLSAAEMENQLTGYAGPDGFALPVEYWAGIASHARTAPVTVTATIRASNGSSFTESTSTFVIAPVDAGGAMVYWASSATPDLAQNSKLVGFSVGEEGTIEALTPFDVATEGLRREDYTIKDGRGTDAGKVSCIGCHTSTPDGTAVVFNDGWPWAGIAASIEEGSKGVRPSGVTDLGARLMQIPFIGTFTFSKDVWDGGSRLTVATLTPGDFYGPVRNLATSGDLIWVDLAAAGSADLGADGAAASAALAGLEDTAWGRIARTGDSRAPANPVWSPNGATIVYSSVAQVAGSHLGGLDPTNAVAPDKPLAGNTEADLYAVPFNDKAGGAALAIPGASQAGVAEYYPDFSSDGALLAFNKSGTNGYIYYRTDGEVNVIPAAGGTAHRLVANDPPACTGEASPGVINSWAKWSPSADKVGDVTYYWVIFSSARAYPEQFELQKDTWTPAELDTRSSQLYLAAIAVDGSGNITSYPAVYVWNQTTDTSNLTPAWDEFKIPPVTIR